MDVSISMGTLYELNQQVLKNAPAASVAEIYNYMTELTNYIKDSGNKYFMLLNKERSDYTIFIYEEKANELAEEVVGCLTDRGALLAIEQQDNGAFECWIRKSGLVYMYCFFPYDSAVIIR